MAFNELLLQLGGVGRFQWAQFTLVVLPMLLMASHNTIQNFTAAIPSHHCRPPPSANLSGDSVEAEELWAWLPRDEQGRPESCRRFTSPQRGPHWPNGTGLNRANATEACLDGWLYDHSTFPSTIVTEWDLVCSHKVLRHLGQSLYMLGVLVGASLFGNLADRLGRRKILIWVYLQTAVSGTCCAFSSNLSTYCVFRFLIGASLAGMALNTITLNTEWMPIHTRATVAALVGYAYSIGQFVLAGCAYAVPHWRWLQLLTSLPFFIFFLYSWFFIESARWHASTGRLDLTLQALKKVAWINGKQEEGEKLNIEALQIKLHKEMTLGKSRHTTLDLVRLPTLRCLFCCLSLMWFATSFAYYGLVMDLQYFGTNIYLTQVIFGVVDLPAKLIGFLITNYIGRRPAQMASLLLAGISILVNALVPKDWGITRTSLAVLGKGCLASSFNCAFLYTGELYPTVIRQTGLGMGSMMARVGSIMSPLVNMTGEFYPALPSLIYGAVPIAGGVVTFFLPETLNMPLPESVEDLKARSHRKKEKEEAEEQTIPLQTLGKNGLQG
ncbi:solute carrier family 22 member 6-like [Gracilinanus agilis]|uniref:solute carrier family 22 member 6-like n=1 Tax=Gracilinanus agilis TaxID=191870 RepID=UPI001CFE2AF9|nr:solute carrier family 22 member 6-like [Gracilinanus agilis]